MTTPVPAPQPGLARRLGLADAVVLGMGSMLGAGVFAAFGPAAAAAGSGLLVALAVAGVVAWANATSSARLAARYPESGGTYVYGRRRLGPVWGFLAGWGFVVGKTASCAAMALTVGAYAWPAHPRVVAAAVVVAGTAVSCLGVTRTARVSRVLVVLTLAALATVVAAALAGPRAERGARPLPARPGRRPAGRGPAVLRLRGLRAHRDAGRGGPGPGPHDPAGDHVALAAVLGVYAVVGAAALAAVGPAALAASPAPLLTAAGGSGCRRRRRPGRRHARGVRCAAVPVGGGGAHDAGDGPRPRAPARAGRRAPAAPGPAPGHPGRRRRRAGAGPAHRPAARRRVLEHGRPRLLRGRQHLRAHARAASGAGAGGRGARPDRLRRADRDAAPRRRRHRARRAGGGPGRPGRAAPAPT